MKTIMPVSLLGLSLIGGAIFLGGQTIGDANGQTVAALSAVTVDADTTGGDSDGAVFDRLDISSGPFAIPGRG